MNSAFTILCPSLNLRLSQEELQAYGVAADQATHCPGPAACTNAHSQADLRRPLFLQNDTLAYWPVLCAQQFIPRAQASNEGSLKPISCAQGDFCQSAHSMKEILYHPLTFKTTPCHLNHDLLDSI